MGAMGIGAMLPALACGLLMFAGFAGLALSSAAAGPATAPTTSTRTVSGPASGPAVAIIRVEGTIVSQAASDPLGGASGVAAANVITEHIRRAAADDDVKAIVLAVNSPGGGVNASDLIYQELLAVDKPITVMMGDLAASGGYYISMAAQHIIANPNSLTGSIGVISTFPNAAGLLDEYGVDFVVITSGPRKDFGSPYREMTDEERAYWQTTVDEIYEGFVAIVSAGRPNLSESEIRALADGRVYTGQQALDAGLVDALGYMDDAIADAAQRGAIEGEPRVIEYVAEPTFLELLSQAGPQTPLEQIAPLLRYLSVPSLEFRWIGQ
jgi:protease-4